jgi:hypothetical protein
VPATRSARALAASASDLPFHLRYGPSGRSSGRSGRRAPRPVSPAPVAESPDSPDSSQPAVSISETYQAHSEALAKFHASSPYNRLFGPVQFESPSKPVLLLKGSQRKLNRLQVDVSDAPLVNSLLEEVEIANVVQLSIIEGGIKSPSIPVITEAILSETEEETLESPLPKSPVSGLELNVFGDFKQPLPINNAWVSRSPSPPVQPPLSPLPSWYWDPLPSVPTNLHDDYLPRSISVNFEGQYPTRARAPYLYGDPADHIAAYTDNRAQYTREIEYVRVDLIWFRSNIPWIERNKVETHDVLQQREEELKQVKGKDNFACVEAQFASSHWIETIEKFTREWIAIQEDVLERHAIIEELDIQGKLTVKAVVDKVLKGKGVTKRNHSFLPLVWKITT